MRYIVTLSSGRMVECPSCRGRGIGVPFNYRACDRCDGRATVHADVPVFNRFDQVDAANTLATRLGKIVYQIAQVEVWDTVDWKRIVAFGLEPELLLTLGEVRHLVATEEQHFERNRDFRGNEAPAAHRGGHPGGVLPGPGRD